MLEVAGATNVFADQKRESVQASSEMLLALAPEVVIELRVEADGPVDLSAWQRVAGAPGCSGNRIIVLDGHQSGDGRTSRRTSHGATGTGAPSGGVLVDRRWPGHTHDGAKVRRRERDFVSDACLRGRVLAFSRSWRL